MKTVYDALVYYCTHKCIGDCYKPPCCAYQLGDVEPRYPVPATIDNAIYACWYNSQAIDAWWPRD